MAGSTINVGVLRALLTLDSAQFDAGARKSESSLDKLGKKMSATANLTRQLDSAFKQIFAGITVANAVDRLASSFVNLANEASRLPAIAGSFNRLSGSIGQSGQAMLAVTRTATKGLITDLDLMQSANKAMLLGLPVTAAEMGKLAKAALTLGKAMGQDATTSLDDLITALGRSSPMILDNLGLTVKVGEANEAYAKSLGKSAEQLTTAEQKMAFYKAAMEAADRKTAELGDVALNATDQLKRLANGATNAAMGLVSGANESRGFAGLLGMAADKAEQFKQNIDDLNVAAHRIGAEGGLWELILKPSRAVELQSAAIDVQLERLTKVAEGLAPKLRLPEPFSVKGPTAAETAKADQETADLKALVTKRLTEQRAAAEKLADAMGELNSVGQDWVATLDTIDGAVVEAIKYYLEAGIAQDKLATAYGLTAAQIKAVGEALQFETMMRKAAVDSTQRLNDEAKKNREDTLERANAAVRDSIFRDIDAQREAVRVSRDADVQRAESAIDAAKLTGASWQQVAALEQDLARKRLAVSVAAINEEFDLRKKALDRSVPAQAREYDRLAELQKQKIQSTLDAFTDAERIKQLELRRTHDLVFRLWDSISGSVQGLRQSVTGGLGSLLFGFGKDTRDAKDRADELHQEYLKLQDKMRHGVKVSAESMKLAMDRWREAEEKANYTFAERWADVWQGIKKSFENILNDMLQFFVESFLKRMIAAAAGARLASWLGIGLGGGAVAAGAGAGAAAAAGGAVAGSATLGTVIGAGGATAAGAGAATGTLTGTVTAGSGGALGSLGAFFTNPWTIGIGAAALGIGLLVKSGFGRGGWEGIEGNRRRDQLWLRNFGGSNPQDASLRGAAWLTANGAGEGGGALWRAIQRADSKREFESAQAALAAFGSQHGKRIQMFNLGGFVPPGAVVPAVLHGGQFGEDIVPRGSGGGGKTVIFKATIQAWDSRDVRRALREDLIPEMKWMLINDTDGIGTAIEKSSRSFSRPGA